MSDFDSNGERVVVTVLQRRETAGAEYVLRLPSGEERSIGDAESDYWRLAAVIDNRFSGPSSENEYNWAIIAADGSVLDRFATDQEAQEATYTGEYPDDAEIAYINVATY